MANRYEHYTNHGETALARLHDRNKRLGIRSVGGWVVWKHMTTLAGHYTCYRREKQNK